MARTTFKENTAVVAVPAGFQVQHVGVVSSDGAEYVEVIIEPRPIEVKTLLAQTITR